MHPYRDHCSEVAPGLFVGATPARVGEVDPDFSVIVSLYRDKPYGVHQHQVVVQAMMQNTAASPFNKFPDEGMLRRLARLTAVAVARMRPVLVHCDEGFDRSGLIAALALCAAGEKPAEAVRRVMARRIGALGNAQFVEWILKNGRKA